jgi:hypothetical protein
LELRDRLRTRADVAQLAERVLGKDEVTSSILVIGSNFRARPRESWPADAMSDVGAKADWRE